MGREHFRWELTVWQQETVTPVLYIFSALSAWPSPFLPHQRLKARLPPKCISPIKHRVQASLHSHSQYRALNHASAPPTSSCLRKQPPSLIVYTLTEAVQWGEQLPMNLTVGQAGERRHYRLDHRPFFGLQSAVMLFSSASTFQCDCISPNSWGGLVDFASAFIGGLRRDSFGQCIPAQVFMRWYRGSLIWLWWSDCRFRASGRSAKSASTAGCAESFLDRGRNFGQWFQVSYFNYTKKEIRWAKSISWCQPIHASLTKRKIFRRRRLSLDFGS